MAFPTGGTWQIVVDGDERAAAFRYVANVTSSLFQNGEKRADL